MKRKIYSLVILLLALVMSACTFVGCQKEDVEDDDTTPVTESSVEIESKTDTLIIIKVNNAEEFDCLLDAMDYLKEQGELDFEIAGGMITSIEGKENPADWSACWMLYTSDAELSNSEWGTITVGESVYGSAIVGADVLEVVDGEYYVWSFDKV